MLSTTVHRLFVASKELPFDHRLRRCFLPPPSLTPSCRSSFTFPKLGIRVVILRSTMQGRKNITSSSSLVFQLACRTTATQRHAWPRSMPPLTLPKALVFDPKHKHPGCASRSAAVPSSSPLRSRSRMDSRRVKSKRNHFAHLVHRSPFQDWARTSHRA